MDAPRVRPLYLVGVDGSPESDRALRYALDLARGQRADVRIITVEDLTFAAADAAGGAVGAAAMTAYTQAAEEILAQAVKQASAAGVKATTLLVPLANPATAIVKEAKARRAALVVVGSRGRTGLARALLGSVAEAVVRHARCPVLVVH